MKRIYLDNNASTPLDSSVLDLLVSEFQSDFGNASSIHEEGQRARRRLEEAREAVSALIGASPREVVFTSGGTESNNAALIGAARARGDRCHIVTAAIEHPSVLEPVRQLEREGHPVTWIAANEQGVVLPEAIGAALRENTGIVALMLANNESGAIQPVAEAVAISRARRIHFHCDAVQAAGKIPIDVSALGVDTMAMSGHKMHAPKGVGALYVRSGSSLQSLIAGGAQERRRRAGTENVPLAAAFGEAARLSRDPAKLERMAALRDRFEKSVVELLPETVVNARGALRLPNTSNLRFRDCDAEGIVIALDLAGIACSTGSACSSGRVEPSHVLLAMGLSVEDARSSVRFSLSRFTTDEEIDRTVQLLAEIVPRHRRSLRASGAQ